MRRHYKLFIFVLLLFLSIGFAYLTVNLDVTGTIAFRENTWDVHLDNIVVEEDSGDADNPTINTDKDTVNFSISLTRPGDYYEFYVDVVNAGTMDATLDSTVKSTLTGNYLTNLDYNVTYYSDRTITKGDLLRAGCKERIKVRVEYKYDVDTYTKLDDINLFFKVNYIKTDIHASTYNSKVWDFEYKGEEDTFTVPKAGTYKLEVWGASGGKYTDTYRGGYGGYSSGQINLNASDNLFIVVGGSGYTVTGQENLYAIGGYNGGGNGSTGSASSSHVSSGGGATHIATGSIGRGLLKNYSSYKNDVIMVAGGGGGTFYFSGSYRQTKAGDGGGYIGTYSTGYNYGVNGKSYNTNGGMQESAGAMAPHTHCISSFGKSCNPTWQQAPGGGGGWYAGNVGMYTAGGGSGYIGNTNLTDKIMYCYNCQESTEEADETHIKTRSTTNVSETPTSNYAKIGHGYAKITYVGN